MTEVRTGATRSDPGAARALDGLAVAAVVIALVPLPLLGIAHSISQLLVAGVLVIFARLSVVSEGVGLRRALRIGRPPVTRSALLITAIGPATALIRWLIDTRLLHGRGGLAFYAGILRQYHVLDPDGRAHWVMLVPLAAATLLMILIDGVFYVGLIQRRLARHLTFPFALVVQAGLFALVHTFSGPAPDIAYGVGAGVGGLVYGYVFERMDNQWIPATMLWLHVIGVFALMMTL
jgi:membrane protease YdiL (CAAX protease family)